MLPKYIRDIINGQKFDKIMRKFYDFVQIKLTNNKILDALDIAKKCVISHKYTQLATIKLATAKYYINELCAKYGVLNATSSRKIEDSICLKGFKLILEIPRQIAKIPKTLIRYAKLKGVKIREINEEINQEVLATNFL